MSDFPIDNQRSKDGVVVLTQFLQTKNWVKEVTNVEEDPAFFKPDIDLLVHPYEDYFAKLHRSWQSLFIERNGKMVLPVECKIDFTPYLNFHFETISNDVTGSPGWILKTKAPIVFYYFTRSSRRQLYILQMEPLRHWFLNNIYGKYPEVPNREPTVCSDGSEYYTWGILCDIKATLWSNPPPIIEIHQL